MKSHRYRSNLVFSRLNLLLALAMLACPLAWADEALDRQLLEALIAEDADEARAALVAGADPDAMLGPGVDEQALCTAIDSRGDELLTLLVEFGATLETTLDASGFRLRSPVACAVHYYNPEAFDLLLELGADPDPDLCPECLPQFGHTPLTEALAMSRFPMALRLIEETRVDDIEMRYLYMALESTALRRRPPMEPVSRRAHPMGPGSGAPHRPEARGRQLAGAGAALRVLGARHGRRTDGAVDLPLSAAGRMQDVADIGRRIRSALPGPSTNVAITGEGELASWFATTELAVQSVAAAARELLRLTGGAREARVDRGLVARWFTASARPVGWELPPDWDALAGDYRARDGWIRLHTNAPHHRAAALRVLGCAPEREAVETRVAALDADALEAAVVDAGGAAARMRSVGEWRAHPQGAIVHGSPLVARETAPASAAHLPAFAAASLRGLRVLDLTRVLAGPVCTRFLAAFGAQVLRLDPPHWDEPANLVEMTLGKRRAGLDLRLPGDRETFAHLLRRAHVLVHGYRPGALDALGFGAEERRALNPSLVDVSLSAYGTLGPWGARRGFDSLVQMSAGIAEAGMRRSGADRPVPLPVQALDHATGYLMAAEVLRGLRELRTRAMATTSRLSLAKVADLLADFPTSPVSAPMAMAIDDDFPDRIERTGLGDVRRLAFPVEIAGAPTRWPEPAGRLRMHKPRWCREAGSARGVPE